MVELLVVIGIIAVLTGLLLAALGSARRQAGRVKCLASLKEIGNGFKLYAVDYKGAWPVALHQGGMWTPTLPLLPESRHWSDLLARYVSGAAGKNLNKAEDVDKLRFNSVIWGCPAWDGALGVDAATYQGKTLTGYAMQYEPLRERSTSFRDMAMIGSSVPGRYVKSWEWNVRGSDRAMVGCAVSAIISGPQKFSVTSTDWHPFIPSPPNGPPLFFDSTRHLKAGTSKAASTHQQGLNMLFADGHAQPVSICEAWNAMANPGMDTVKP